jgi:hypothetical protein
MSSRTLAPELLARPQPPLAGDQAAVAAHHDRVQQADLGDARRKAVDVAEVFAMARADADAGDWQRGLRPLKRNGARAAGMGHRKSSIGPPGRP